MQQMLEIIYSQAGLDYHSSRTESRADQGPWLLDWQSVLVSLTTLTAILLGLNFTA